MTEKFVWGKDNVLWHSDMRMVAGWVDFSIPDYWYARTAGTVDRPVVRAEFDNEAAARDFLMFIANAENSND